MYDEQQYILPLSDGLKPAITNHFPIAIGTLLIHHPLAALRIPVPLDLNLFCYIYNLFDQKDELRVYSDTRSARTTTTIDPEQISYDPRRVGSIEDYVMQSSWFSEPRQIQAGLALEF